MEVNYIGEHLLPGQLGNFLLVLAFVSALLSSLSFFFSVKLPLQSYSWKQIGKWSFRVHSWSLFGVIAVLFYLIFNHYFEYQYVYQHSNKALPLRYMLSCFWEGQEGSFMLWAFWQAFLGLLFIRFAKEWTAPVMAVVSSVQAFLISMLLGIVLFSYKFGSNPFTLLRDQPEMANLPWVKVPNYLEQLDGRGLNPLLQNYWMTIHPPTLFLGFALTLFPFAFAISGLWTKKYVDWQKPALPWTFIGILVLGIGILMGGAWAYESLSFGGFWAWDPVENASLVPWLTLVAAGHVMLISRNNATSVVFSMVLTLVTFILVLYSTFLTRSGILGETSVHAFTDLGMSGQLLVYLLFYIALSVFLIARHFKQIPGATSSDELWSREFWMFIGSLLLCISAFQIIFTTSIPVINKVLQLEKKIAPPTDPIAHYNSWQLPFAVAVALLIAVAQFFKYKKTAPDYFVKKIVWSFGLAIVSTLLTAYLLSFSKFYYGLLLFTSVFAVLSNADYWLRVLKGKINGAGASIAHIGFGLILLGILISTSLKQTISQNTSGMSVESLGKDFKNSENILLTKGDTLRMGEYYVTYQKSEKQGINMLYQIDYLEKVGNEYIKSFSLFPLIQLNDRMGNVAEPDTRHFLHKDVYTHITYVDLGPKNENEKKETEAKGLAIGDSLFASNAIVIVEGINKEVDKKALKLQENDLAIGLQLKVLDINSQVQQVEPVFVIRDNYIYPVSAMVENLGLEFQFTKLDPKSGKVDVLMKESKAAQPDFLVLKALVFPGINILWLGCIVMAFGTFMAVVYRVKKLFASY